MLNSVLWVALGGALGAVSRFLLTTALFVPGRFPWPTLLINVIGSFGIGLLWGMGLSKPWFESWGRYLLVVGLLGGFTTFSAFSLETVGLFQGGRLISGIAYVMLSVFTCIGCAWLGQRLVL